MEGAGKGRDNLAVLHARLGQEDEGGMHKQRGLSDMLVEGKRPDIPKCFCREAKRKDSLSDGSHHYEKDPRGEGACATAPARARPGAVAAARG